MIVTAYSPLGNGRSYAALGHSDVVAIEEDVVVKIANRLNVTPAQVVLRWGVQRGCAVIPKSENETHIKANLDIAGFALSDEDMEAIKELEKNFRMFDPGQVLPEYFDTLCPIWD